MARDLEQLLKQYGKTAAPDKKGGMADLRDADRECRANQKTQAKQLPVCSVMWQNTNSDLLRLRFLWCCQLPHHL